MRVSSLTDTTNKRYLHKCKSGNMTDVFQVKQEQSGVSQESLQPRIFYTERHLSGSGSHPTRSPS